MAFYFDNQPFLERTKLSEASSLTILSFTLDSSELFYLIFIFYFECLVRSQPKCSPLYRVPPLQSEREFIISGRYMDAAFDIPYHLLNTPRVYTRFIFDKVSRPSVLDFPFINTALSPQVSSWETPLPSTGSDHVPCVITLKPPARMLPPHPALGPPQATRSR